MRRLIALIVAVGGLALVGVGLAAPDAMTRDEAEAFDRLNTYRVSVGLNALTFNTILYDVAEVHVAEMSRYKVIADLSPIGTNYRAVAYNLGYPVIDPRTGECCTSISSGSAGPRVRSGDGFAAMIISSPDHEADVVNRYGLGYPPDTDGRHWLNMACASKGGYWTCFYGNGVP